jgi:preprotein translocase subunit SecA
MKEAYNQIKVPEERRLFTGVDAFANSIKGKIKSLFLSNKTLRKEASIVHKKSIEFSKLDEDKLLEKMSIYKQKFKLNKVNNNELLEAMAIVVELGFRVTQKRAYEVQIMGALSMIRGFIIQMSTGEGKTITASLASIILGWSGKPLHVLTSNDYLAQRDAQLLEPFYNKVGLSVGFVIGGMEREEKKEIYKKDIIYSTSKEILADFLRDRMLEDSGYNINSYLIDKLKRKPVSDEYVLRGLHSVIVDEADNVLADEAVTPLIISSKAENRILKEAVSEAFFISQKLQKDEDYKVYEKFNEVVLFDTAIDIIEKNIESLNTIWQSKDRREFLVKQAIMAKELYELNKHYIIKDGEVVIVDEKSGRIMSERTWSNGLHQAIEVKEGLEITDPTTIYSKMSFQRFFRLYNHLCGMSGTLKGLYNEFWQIYGLQIIKIPTRVPSKMNILKDKIFFDKLYKEKALIEYIKNLHERKLPILVGVTTIKDSQSLAFELERVGIRCTLLNALYDDVEAEIIKDAGDWNKITIATNMAGRGTDIHIPDDINKAGGLQVITIQRDRSRRVDLQFFGRCARQGQNGTAVAFLALDDLIMSSYLSDGIKQLLRDNFDNKFVQKLSNWIYIYLQYKIEKNISNLRNETLKKDISIDDAMSFT